MLDLTASGTTGMTRLIAGAGEIELTCGNLTPRQPRIYDGHIHRNKSSDTLTAQRFCGKRATYIGPVIVVTRNVPTQIRFVNDLGNTADTNVFLWRETSPNAAVDQTLHWADPLGGEDNLCNMMVTPGMLPSMSCSLHYSGPIPAVPHLHGGYVPPTIDGGPDAWFTSDGNYKGHGYYTHPAVAAAGNESVYRYPNFQEASPIWFHDHLLGGTRINVYCGLAGAFAIIDPAMSLPAGLTPVGLGGDLLIPLVIQDRMFDVDGQLFFPNVGINPEHLIDSGISW
jgi:FtsP/CotA-like multicopper oxidase with cupredoxin domain